MAKEKNNDSATKDLKAAKKAREALKKTEKKTKRAEALARYERERKAKLGAQKERRKAKQEETLKELEKKRKETKAAKKQAKAEKNEKIKELQKELKDLFNTREKFPKKIVTADQKTEYRAINNDIKSKRLEIRRVKKINIVERVKIWGLILTREMLRVRWIKRGELNKKFLWTLGFIIAFIIFFVIIDEIIKVVFHATHAL